MSKFNKKLIQWFSKNEIQKNKDEIIGHIKNSNNLNSLQYNGMSIVFWAARYRHGNILEEALKYQGAENIINSITTYEGHQHTALSISAYHGYDEIIGILLKYDANIEITDANGEIIINAYKALGNGYLRNPINTRSYALSFEKLINNNKTRYRRKNFSDKYTLTPNDAYLICLMLYDRFKCLRNDRNGQGKWYKSRDILTVEDAAVRRFFRFNKKIKETGQAHQLVALLKNTTNITNIVGYSARTMIIALINIMNNTPVTSMTGSLSFFTAPFKLGLTEFRYSWMPARWQPGNCILTVQSGNVNQIAFGANLAEFLEILTETNGNQEKINSKTKKLGKLLLEKTKLLNSFHENEFSYCNNKLSIRLDNELTPAILLHAQNTIHKLNGLLILWSIIEPARRLSGHLPEKVNKDAEKEYHDYYKNSINIDHIPIATMQIRALQLLANGYAKIRDIFGESDEYNSIDNPDRASAMRAKYGVSTGQNVVNQDDGISPHYSHLATRKAYDLAHIAVPHLSLASENSFFSRNYSKQILVSGYGIGNESDNDNYSDDGSDDNFPNLFKRL